jgi:hypothetical protein
MRTGHIGFCACQLDPAMTDALRITQIADASAGERPPSEIVNAIIEQRASFDIAELAELLGRAKELQVQPRGFNGYPDGRRGGDCKSAR